MRGISACGCVEFAAGDIELVRVWQGPSSASCLSKREDHDDDDDDDGIEND